jgi:hypothetical protein
MSRLSSTPHRSVLLAAMLVLGLGSAIACVDEEVLENEDCQSDADCFKKQQCLLTPYQASLAAPIGWCRADGDSCAEGLQPGCACEPSGLQMCCSNAGGETLVPHQTSDGLCLCVIEGDPNFPAATGTMPTFDGRCYTP